MKKIIGILILLSLNISLSCSLIKPGERGKVFLVTPDGTWAFTKIQDAIDNVPKNNVIPVIILIKPGKYNEQVHISKDRPFITLKGEERKRTVITASVPHKNPADSGVIRIDADNITLEALTIKNTHKLGSGAEMAVRVLGNKNILIKKCALYGKQDTVYFYGGGSQGRIFDSYIEGVNDILSVDGNVVVERTHFFLSRRDGHAIWLYGQVFVKNCVFDGKPKTRAIRFAADKAVAYFVENTYTENVSKFPINLGTGKAKIFYFEPQIGLNFPKTAVRLKSAAEVDFNF